MTEDAFDFALRLLREEREAEQRARDAERDAFDQALLESRIAQMKAYDEARRARLEDVLEMRRRDADA
jgi:uncharacterized protein (UPF0216 family)